MTNNPDNEPDNEINGTNKTSVPDSITKELEGFDDYTEEERRDFIEGMRFAVLVPELRTRIGK